MKLTFEHGAQDAAPEHISGQWFQITYSSIRNSEDEEIAFYSNGFWTFNNKIWTDIIIGG